MNGHYPKPGGLAAALAVLIGSYLLAEVGIACLWMRCPHCGKPLNGGEGHCPRCGGRLER